MAARWNKITLLTERKRRTGKYHSEGVAVLTERSEVHTKQPRAIIPQYSSYKLG